MANARKESEGASVPLRRENLPLLHLGINIDLTGNFLTLFFNRTIWNNFGSFLKLFSTSNLLSRSKKIMAILWLFWSFLVMYSYLKVKDTLRNFYGIGHGNTTEYWVI